MGKFLDYIKDKMDLKSHRDRMDERFENGIQVASAPLARNLTTFGGRTYKKMKNGKVAFNTSPRDIIRNGLDEFPLDLLAKDPKYYPYAANKKDFIKAYSDVRDARERNESFDPLERRAEYAKEEHLPDLKTLMKDFNFRNPLSDMDSWKNYVAARKSSKEQGRKLGREFARQNANEKAEYRKKSGVNAFNVEEAANMVRNQERRVKELESIPKEYRDEAFIENERRRLDDLKRILTKEKRPKKALGGQNAQYLENSLDLDSPQEIYDLGATAKPIHYDKDGNPYVRGFTWTQTGNIPKITDPNSGYLATVGADTKNYHPHVKGQWTSEGWGNPMDKNYENYVAPGEVRKFLPNELVKLRERLYDITSSENNGDFERLQALQEEFSDGRINGREYFSRLGDYLEKYGLPTEKSFDEQLLETRWPLKFYQKAPFINQGGTQERVTVMEAGPGAKDVHRPIVKEVPEMDDAMKAHAKWYEDYQNALHDVKKNVEDAYEAEIDEIKRMNIPYMQKFDLRQNLRHKYDSIEREEARKVAKDFESREPENGKMIFVNKPVGTSVDKVATPSRMITAHMEDNMPSEWTMHDRRNGGKTIAGWHPNKKWSDMNAENFADEVRKLNPELYNEISKAYEDEYGLVGMELAANGPKFVGRWFLENPDKLEALKQSKVSDITRVMERGNELEPQYALIDRARANSLLDKNPSTPYEYALFADNLPSRDVFAKGSMYRGEKPYTFSRTDDETPKSVMDFYEQLEAKRNVIRERWNKNGKISAEDEKELVRLNDLAERIEEDYGW